MELVKAPNLSLINKSHENKWVALSIDYKKILASSGSLISLKKKTCQDKAVFMHVLPANNYNKVLI
jgi:hypothetical protein